MAEVKQDCEYQAYVWNKDKGELVPVGGTFGNEYICRARLDEKIEKGWLPEYLDDSRTQIRKRKVTISYGEWEVID